MYIEIEKNVGMYCIFQAMCDIRTISVLIIPIPIKNVSFQHNSSLHKKKIKPSNRLKTA